MMIAFFCRFAFRSHQWCVATTTLILVFAVSSCHHNLAGGDSARTAAMALVLDDADAPQTALYWVRNNRGEYQTLLLNGNKNQTVALASVDSLVLSSGKAVFEVLSPVDEVLLCDCASWEKGDSECPSLLESAPRQSLLLSRIDTPDTSDSDEETTDSVDLFPFDVPDDALPRLAALNQTAVVTGTVGPYIFIRYERTYQLCGDEDVTETHGYRVFNLDSMAFESVLSDEERTAVDEQERQDAYDAIRSTTGFQHVNAEELQITEIRPVFVYGLGFSLQYQFEAQSRMDEKTNNWRDYTRQVSVQAREIPTALRPYALAPSLVRNLVPGENVSVGGWMIVSGTRAANLALLEKLFSVAPETDMDGDSLSALPQE